MERSSLPVLALVTLISVILFPFVSKAMIVLPDHFDMTIDHGNNASGVFRITPENVSFDGSIWVSSPFDFSFNKTVFTNLNTFFDNEFTVSVPKYFPAGTYPSTIWVQGENQTRRINFSITVPKMINYSLVANNNISIILGSSKVIMLDIYNTGNAPVSVTYALETDIKDGEIDAGGNLTAYHYSVNRIPLSVYVPETVTPGNYTVNVTANVEGYDLTKTVSTSVEVIDNILPEIYEMNMPDEIIAGGEFDVSFRVRDNKNVSSVKIFFDNDEAEAEIVKGEYVNTFMTKKIEGVPLEIIVTDTSGNELDEKFNLTVLKNDVVSIDKIAYTQIQRGYKLTEPFFISIIPIKMKASVEAVQCPHIFNTTECDYRLALAYEGKEFGLEEGQEIDFDNEEVTDLELIFEPNITGLYELKITFDIPEWAGDDKTASFRTMVGELNIPESVSNIVGNAEVFCLPNISETNFPESVWICEQTYPITTDPNDLGRIMTEFEWDLIKSSCESEKAVLTGDKETLRFQLQMLFIILILVAVIPTVIYLFFGRGYIYYWR